MRLFAVVALLLFAALSLPSPAPQRPASTPVADASLPSPAPLRAVVKYTLAQPEVALKPIGQQPAPAPQPPTLTVPAEVHVTVGAMSQLLIKTETGAALHLQWVPAKPAGVFREFEPDPTTLAYQVLGTKPGTFYLVVFAVKGTQVTKATCTVTVAAATPPVPPPAPPAPAPPVPTDPLTVQLQTLYTADPATAAEKLPVKQALAGLYGGLAQQLGAGQYATVQDLSTALKVQAAALPLGLNLLPLRRACAAQVAAAIGPAPAAKLEPPLRATLASTFSRLSVALAAVK